MKKISFLSLALICYQLLVAQPHGFSYQAVVRNSSGELIANQLVNFRLSLIDESSSPTYYVETHIATTTPQGIANLIVGEGSIVAGVFADVPWETSNINLKVDVDPTGGNTFNEMGIVPLKSVPYALYAPSTGVVTSNPEALDDDPIFVVRNKLGDIVFAVYQSGVRMYVDESTTKSNRGGFAIGGIGDNLKLGNTYFQVTPDSVRVNLREPTVKGSRGGFAIGGIGDNLKEASTSLMHLTPDNYFIGHRAGEAMETGLYNTFIGYETGIKSYHGNGNIFLGFNTGHENLIGALNVFIGNEAGYNFTGEEDGEENIFIGNTAGRNVSTVANSIFIGTRAGYMAGVQTYGNTLIGDRAGANGAIGSQNTFIGASAGFHSTGEYNTYLGSYAGQANYTGSYNVFIGNSAGSSEIGSNKLYIANSVGTPLIYGDFASPKVAINATNPTQALDVNGNGRFRSIGSGAYSGVVNRMADGTLTTSTSDVRLKENINTLSNSLSKVLLLRGVNFTWKSDPSMGKRVGFIAQEVEEVIPELVFTNPTDGYKGVNYAEMTAVLIEAIKEQQKQIEALKAEIEMLKTLTVK